MSFFRVASFSLLFASACGGVETADIEQHIPVLPPGGCDEFGCGSNSPEVDNLGIHDLYGVDGSGVENANGFSVHDISNAGVMYKRIYVKNGAFKVEGASGTLSGSAVAGTHFFVKDAGSAGNIYEIWINGVGRTPMWAHITGSEMAITYTMVWDVKQTAPGQKRNWKNICSNPPPQGSVDVRGMDSFSAVVFETDQIDPARKTVDQRRFDGTSLPENWFNIGCAGHALAKLHLTGHTTAAANAFGFHVDNAIRTAALKMFAADYCGTGYPWTVAGQPLQWLDDGGGSGTPYNVYLPGFAGKKEAVWSDGGAKCLNMPRVLANPTALGTSIFATNLADFQADIKAVCGFLPPACPNADPYDLGGGHDISSNP